MRPLPEHAWALLAVTASLAAAAHVWTGLDELLAPTPSEARAVSTLESFAAEIAPAFDFALDELPQWSVDPVLVDAARVYPGTLQYCDTGEFGFWEDAAASKGRIWFDHANDPARALPEGFFEQPPFLHLSGRSYVGLALERFPKRFDASWVARHRRFLHVLELPLATSVGLELSPPESVVAMLERRDLDALLGGEDVVLLPSWVLVRSTSGASRRYAAHHRDAWDGFVAAQAFSTERYREGAACAARTGAVCWRRDTSEAARDLRFAGLLAAFALLGVVAWSLTRRDRLRRSEERGRRFILQTLTHELRTPAASLALSLETLRRRFDDLPEEAQGAFLRMCEDSQRLRRITDASTQYLRGDGHGLELRSVELPSVQDFIADVVDGYDLPIDLRGPSRAIAVRADPYWLGVCLSNLLDNAVRHGAAPITVVCDCVDDELTIAVEDAGGAAMDVERMLAPFSKRSDSPGLGLGLSVVAQVVEQMGGELRVDREPTRFALHLRGMV